MPTNAPLIVDAHEDLAYNAVSHGRDLMKSAIERRKIEEPNADRGGATTSFPDLILGNVWIVFGTLWANPCGSEFSSNAEPCYSNAEEAYALAKTQLDYYRGLERQGTISIIKTKSQLEEIVDSQERRIGVVILMEGADPIRTPGETKEWFSEGLRIIGPAWGRTRYCGGTNAPGPLTKDGHELLKEMERCGFILDCSHFAEHSFFEALDEFDGTVIASHSNCRIYSPTDRQLSDEMIKRLTSKKGGVIGAVLYNRFLVGNWKKGDPKSAVTLSEVMKNIRHVSEIAGSRVHSGLGSDFDGGFGYESIPLELDTVADLHKIGDALKTEANFSEDEAVGVLGGNFLRILRKALPD
jgi:membrane dipeptidase